jgi:hypothetical protein
MFPIGSWRVVSSLNGEAAKAKLNSCREDDSIWSWNLGSKEGKDLKGAWSGGRLCFVGKRENVWFAGAVHWLRPPNEKGEGVRVFSIGSIWLVLLFLVFCAQILFFLWRILNGLGAAGVGLGDLLSLKEPVKSPLIQILITATFYTMLYFNLYRRNVTKWKRYLHVLLA